MNGIVDIFLTIGSLPHTKNQLHYKTVQSKDYLNKCNNTAINYCISGTSEKGSAA